MAVTQADLDNLNAAILGAELEVEYQGRRVRYRSVAELRSAYEHAKSEMATQSASQRKGGSFSYHFTTQRGD
ncbi:MAG: hypothetical protein RL375_4133 [Pseudomonadota bacterium]